MVIILNIGSDTMNNSDFWLKVAVWQNYFRTRKKPHFGPTLNRKIREAEKDSQLCPNSPQGFNQNPPSSVGFFLSFDLTAEFYSWFLCLHHPLHPSWPHTCSGLSLTPLPGTSTFSVLNSGLKGLKIEPQKKDLARRGKSIEIGISHLSLWLKLDPSGEKLALEGADTSTAEF